MLNNKTILAVIPARGGSKGIPKKNIKICAGKPLIGWTIIEAQKSKYIDRLILSSDSSEIINVSKQFSIEVPFVRPEKLAQDHVPGVDPLIHAVNSLDTEYDYVILLQVTSPLRTVTHIDKAIEFCIKNNVDSCISVYKTLENPHHFISIDKHHTVIPVITSESFIPRQNIPDYYKINGAFFMLKTNTLIKTKDILNKNTKAFIMDKESSIDVDTLEDFETADLILKKRLQNAC